MSSSVRVNFSTLCVGLKGERFLRKVLENGYVPCRVASYPITGEDGSPFENIKELCKTYDTVLEISKHPRLVDDELTFIVGWQYLINAPEARLIVFHDSLLPRYRGFAPTVSALVNGDDYIGVSAIFPTKGADKGPLIGQKRIQLNYPIKIAAALSLQAHAMAELAVEIIQKEAENRIEAVAQDESHATYSLWRDEDDYHINWSEDAARIKRTVDALGFPYSGAKSFYLDEPVQIIEATEVEDLRFEIRQPGKLWHIDQGRPVVVCGKGLVRLDEVRDKTGSLINFKRLRVRFA